MPETSIVENKETEERYHILAAVGEPAQQSVLLQVGCALAHDSGLVTLLCITPDGTRPDWLIAEESCDALPVRVQVRAGNDASHAILDAVRELEPDLLLLGWSGEQGARRYLLGSTLDPVTRYAPCDVAIVRADKWQGVQSALAMVGGGPNASLAIDLARRLSPDVQVTAANIARTATGPLGVAAGREQLTRMLEPWSGDTRVTAKVVRSSGVIDGILCEAALGYDILLIGASNESYIDRKLFGNVPQTVAERASIPTLIVRRRAGPLKSFLRQAQRVLSGVEDYMTTAERVQTYREIRRGARPRLDFFMMIGFAAAIASLGLLINSPAVIIGAMVIAPLMSAIFGISMGIVQGDIRLLWQAAGTTLRGAGLAIAIGILIGLMVPTDAPTSEIMSRAHPTLMDLVIALISGAAGAYALCRRNALGALAGVAIAVALVPPLATTGIGLRLGSSAIAGGALLLFLTNLSAITTAASVVFRLFGFRPDPGKRVRVFSRSMVGVLVLLLVVSILLTALTIDSVLERRLSYGLQTALAAEVEKMQGVELESWHIVTEKSRTVLLEVAVRATRPISHQESVDLQERMTTHLRRPVALVLSVTHITQLDPLVPPTPAAQESETR